MEGYAPAFVAHNIPYIVVSGLGVHAKEAARKDGGVRISSAIPPLESDDALALLKHFKDSDGTNLAWNGREHNGRNKFRVKTIGRDYILPPRHASPLAAIVGTSPTARPVLHSSLSPLSPGSSVFPDGLVDSRWIDKHQDRVPSAFICFYNFTSDPKLSTLHDNQLKTDINNIKKVLTDSGYKTRLAVALLSEKSIVQSPDVEDRLANIRKATGIDSKTSFFFLAHQSSPVEVKAWVESILSTTYPLSIEYYRDLSKHSRRKRNRGTVPLPTSTPTIGISKMLSNQGWNVRYDFKLGVFAEFRQEMDSAVRSYESGYDLLLGPDVLESITSWSPRWNEARLLSDIFALRIIRCLLWNGNTTAAVRRWQSHRERIRDLVDRRGKGSLTYGWQAWEARWASVMGEMINKVAIPEFGGTTIYLQAEKTIATGERIQPWEYLHHPGYWFRAASKHTAARQALAMVIPEEDRSPPGSSPASQIASKSYTYDSYLCPEPHEESPLPGYPGVNHSEIIVALLARAIGEFKKRKQRRLMQELQLAMATENTKQGAWENAMQVLRPLWQNMTYRKEGWWNSVEEVGWALRKAAVNTGDGASIIAVDWELMNKNFTHHQNWHYDLGKSLQGLESDLAKPAVVLLNAAIHSFLSATYSFEHAEEKVGEPCFSQFSVVSSAMPSSAPITMSEVRIEFEGSLKPLILRHQVSSNPSDSKLAKVILSETTHAGRPSLTGDADLTFRPGQTKVFEFSFLPREAGDAKAVSATFSMASETFDLEYVHTFEQSPTPDLWWGETAIQKRIVRPNAASINILPKPPKMVLKFLGQKEQYYTNEHITLQVEVTNGEEEDSIAKLQVQMLGEGAPEISIKLLGATEPISEEDTPIAGMPLGKISAGTSTIIEILIPPIFLPATYDLSLKTSYHLISDLETPIYRSASMQLEIHNPFEANYDFAPRIHPDPWPSYFTHSESEEPSGLAQRWHLTARYGSFAADELVVSDVALAMISSQGNIHSSTKILTPLPSEGLIIAPKSLEEAQFEISTQKMSLDDRGGATLDVSLLVKWRRKDGDERINTTTLGVPRLLVTSSEPRVLSSLIYSPISQSLSLSLHVENPSSHHLTFSLSLEPSTLFAFSGPKQTTIQLVPLSRRTVSFKLLPYVKGEWCGPVSVVVRDRYFQKVLRVLGCEGVRVEKEGLMVWVPPDDEEEEEEDDGEGVEESEEGDE